MKKGRSSVLSDCMRVTVASRIHMGRGPAHTFSDVQARISSAIWIPIGDTLRNVRWAVEGIIFIQELRERIADR